MKFLFTRRWNLIDITTIAVAMAFLSRDMIAPAIITIILGLAISAVGEIALEKQNGR